MIKSKPLLDLLIYTLENSDFYGNHFNDYKHLINGDSFSMDVFKKLPFTSKDDLSKANDSFCCVPKNEIAEIVTTSGTTGSPISLYLTKNDLTRLAINEEDSLRIMGSSSNDLFQLLTTIDKQFMAGLAYYLGVQRLGAGMIRIGPGVPELQWTSILKYEPTRLIAVPSFILTLIEYAKNNGIEINKSSVEAIVCIGEPIRNNDFSYNSLGKRITEGWDIEIFSTYASSEMGAAFSECIEQKGCHLNEDLLYLEVLNEDGSEVGDEESGEIVVSTLQVEGTPLIRYRTGDIATIYRSKCDCGNKTPRLGPIIGRKNQMIKYKGTTLYPKAIFDVLDAFKQVSCYKVLVEKTELGNDDIKVLLESTLEASSTLEELKQNCRAKLRVIPAFEFLEINALKAEVYKKNMRKPEKIKFF